MVREAIYSPHYDFFIDYADRPSGYDMRTFHIHKKFEVYYQVSGPRRYYIDDASYLINAGNIVLIGPDSVHKTNSVENMPHIRYVLNFNREYLQPLEQALGGQNLFACFDANQHVLAVSPKKQSIVQGLLQSLWERQAQAEPAAIALRKVALAELLLLLAEYVAQSRADANERIQNPTIERIQSYISAHYAQKLVLPEIAAQFHISPNYLSRLFKKTTNLTIVEYINSVRLTAARNMLENSNTRIERIGEEVGFSTTTHYSRVFKEGTGLSPQKYRKLYHTARSDA